MDASGLVNSFSEWLKQPFKPQGSVTDWALFTALIITVAILWTRILKHITE